MLSSSLPVSSRPVRLMKSSLPISVAPDVTHMIPGRSSREMRAIVE
ncbi:MAG: hypothetical protein L6V85_03285 [Clostridiales bacterium]|nr:MAG: hypothetical protein L6V85_03285 [Clostridiales bacterium]